MFEKAEKKPASAENKEQVSTPENEQEISLLGGLILAKKKKEGYVLYRSDGKNVKIKRNFFPVGEIVNDDWCFEKIEEAVGPFRCLIATVDGRKSFLHYSASGSKGEDFVMGDFYADIKQPVQRRIVFKGKTDSPEIKWCSEAQQIGTNNWGYIDMDGKQIFNIESISESI